MEHIFYKKQNSAKINRNQSRKKIIQIRIPETEDCNFDKKSSIELWDSRINAWEDTRFD